MSNISKAFANGKAFISFVTGGDPDIATSEQLILSLVAAGSDLIEIGIPFSDPIAEGPVIAKANLRALANGATTDSVFDMVSRVRGKTDVPLVFLTYMNPVFVYGIDRFFARCQTCGIDGIIIADLPFEESEEVRTTASNCGVDLITLIAPTSLARVQTLAKDAKGFIYLVSSMGVTGVRQNMQTDFSALVAEIRQVTNTPIALGFGISTPAQAQQAAQHVDGVIVGSAIVDIVGAHKENPCPHVSDYVQSMKAGLVGIQ